MSSVRRPRLRRILPPILQNEESVTMSEPDDDDDDDDEWNGGADEEEYAIMSTSNEGTSECDQDDKGGEEISQSVTSKKRKAVTQSRRRCSAARREPKPKKQQSLKQGRDNDEDSDTVLSSTLASSLSYNKQTSVRTDTTAAQTSPRNPKTKNQAKPQKMLKKIQFHGIMTVGMTGARAGDILHGCTADTANVILRVDQGTIKAPAAMRRAMEAKIGKETLVTCMAKQFRLSTGAAAMKYNDCPISLPECPNYLPIGQGCNHDFRWTGGCDCPPAARFTILNQGVWQTFAEEHGHGQTLQEMVQQGQSICYRDILHLMQTPGKPGGKTLILRPKLFKIVLGPVVLSDGDPRLHDGSTEIIYTTTFPHGRGESRGESYVFEIDNWLIRLPKSAPTPPSKEEMCDLILESLQGIPISKEFLTPEQVQSCVDKLKALTVGGLKSLVQKTIRFHALVVDMFLGLGDGNKPSDRLPAALVAATAAGLLFTEAGNFSPELQLYTKGSTSALKRTAITLVEDAWVDHAESSVLSLMALALATQRMPEYEPPRYVVVETMRLAAKAADSPMLIAWRNTATPRNPKTIKVDSEAARMLQLASDLLKVVKSFQGDIKMMETVADTAIKKGKIHTTQALPSDRLPVMPLYHAVDQHTYRGIGHIGPTSGATFAERFKMIFGSTTGFNPRQETTAGFGMNKLVQETRFAQSSVARFAFKVPKSPIPTFPKEDCIKSKLSLDSGTLAAAAGPIPVKVKGKGGKQREVLVMLGVRCPEDEIVMIKPARATRDLFGSLSDEERATAICLAREKQLQAKSPVLKAARMITFRDGCWRLDGVPWEDVVRAGVSLVSPLVQAPEWVDKDDFTCVLKSDEALHDALTTSAVAGLVRNAENLIKRLAGSASDSVSLRAISMCRQQYSKISLPVPALDGGLGSDQLAAYKRDWDVYRLLALIARLAPGALRPVMPPNFAVVDANLLRIVERWMARGMRCKETKVGAGSGWNNNPLWRGMVDAEARLMEHQRCAIASMRRRDSDADTGHFLIMDTGVGKTITSLCYLYRWLVKNGKGVINRIIWVTPKGTVDNLVKQLRGTWSAPVWNVPRLSKAKKPKNGTGDSLLLKDYHVNVIHADHLRDMIDSGLSEIAPTSVIVFDEVDEMYAPTLRTSAARRLAQLCPKFVAQTATPMRKNESQLLAWLADTCSFPVDSNNLLVAASGVVSIQLELGIASQEDLLLVPMIDSVRRQIRELLVDKRWLPMARVVQQNTDSTMAREAVRMAMEDREKYSDGGVLMVADTKDHAEKLIHACNEYGKVRAGGFDTLDSPNAAAFGIVVVPKDKDRGYNSACRLGAMVTGVYAGNGASRHQMRGRLRRLGQRRKLVVFKTVVMENSLLHLLHMRHDAVDSMNISLQELGDKFSTDVLEALEKDA